MTLEAVVTQSLTFVCNVYRLPPASTQPRKRPEALRSGPRVTLGGPRETCREQEWAEPCSGTHTPVPRTTTVRHPLLLGKTRLFQSSAICSGLL